MGRGPYPRARYKFIETTSPGTPPTGVVYLYIKSDGYLYSKDDAGTERQISGLTGGSGNGVDELQWGGVEIPGGSSDTAILGGDSEFNPRCRAFADGQSDAIGTPLFRIPVGAISNINDGQYHKFEAAVICNGATGNAVIYSRWFHYDQSAQARAVSKNAQTVAITSNQVKIVSFTWDRAIDDGDLMYFLFGRNAEPSTTVDGSSGADDTLGGDLKLLWLRYSTTDSLTT